jgi:predicted transglutaminase-like cysteine proteinase
MTKALGMPLLLMAAVGLAVSGSTAFASDSFMRTAGRTTQPVGHYELCQQFSRECRQKTPKGAPVELTRMLWAQMVAINNTVNASIEPRTDMEMWGIEERWSYPVQGQGDCEDYALEKRRLLMDIGVPAGNVLMTVVRQPNGDGHAVLTVRTSRGDFVLDNLEPRIMAWAETDYTYLKRQSELSSGVWVQINDGRADAVASVR